MSTPMRRPNILFLLADNIRYDAVGYLNPDVATPNVDRLAAEGVRFPNSFVTSSVCCVSRASILTGTYGRRHGVWSFADPLSEESLEHSYPRLLKAAGYRTAFFGKYGVGSVSNGKSDAAAYRLDDLPAADAAGFDVVEDTGFAYYLPGDHDGVEHNTRTLTDRAIDFIESTPSEQPFCLSLSFHAPHEGPGDGYFAEPDMLAMYEEREPPTPGPLVDEAAHASLPPFLREFEGRVRQQRWYPTRESWVEQARNYYGLISGIDRGVGRILETLERRGILDDTVVIFTSDNGELFGDYGLEGYWLGYEGSIRVPLVIRPAGTALVREIAEPVLNIDLAPTMLGLAGIRPPDAMQGRDLSPLWSGDTLAEPWRTDFLYEHFLAGPTPEPDVRDRTEAFIPSSEGVRDERYTYLRYPWQAGENEQLFDRVEDPHQLTNVIATAPPDLVERLRRRTDELIARNGAPSRPKTDE